MNKNISENPFSLPIRFQPSIQFQTMDGLRQYIIDYSKFDGIYYRFVYEPLCTPIGTFVEVKFRTIEKITEYVRKYWCI